MWAEIIVKLLFAIGCFGVVALLVATRSLPIKSIRVAADVPEGERSHLEIMRTDTVAFRNLIESRRNRREARFQVQAGRVEIGNVPVPARSMSTSAKK